MTKKPKWHNKLGHSGPLMNANSVGPNTKITPLEEIVALISETKNDDSTLEGYSTKRALSDDQDSDIVYLLVVKPHFAFAYWDISTASIDQAANLVGKQHNLTLRFYNVIDSQTLEYKTIQDIEVFDRIGNWYIKLGTFNQTLVVDIGLKDEDGRYCAISRTHAMTLFTDNMGVSFDQQTDIPLIDVVSGNLDDDLATDHKTLRRILGPHFYGLLMKGSLDTIVGTSAEAVFQDLSSSGHS
jgi:hypothetical protein